MSLASIRRCCEKLSNIIRVHRGGREMQWARDEKSPMKIKAKSTN